MDVNFVKPTGQPRPILGAATPHRPTGAPPSGQPWEDQGRPTLEAADPPWEGVVSSSLGRLEGVLLQSVEEASSNPDQATGTNVFSLSLAVKRTFVDCLSASHHHHNYPYFQWFKHGGCRAGRCWGWRSCRSRSWRPCQLLWLKVMMMRRLMMMWRRRRITVMMYSFGSR